MGESSYSRITIVTVPRKQGAPLEPKLEPSPRLRFLDENGQSYPEWEEKRLGEVSDFVNGYAFKSSEYTPNGKHKVVTIKNVTGDKAVQTESCDRLDKLPPNLSPSHRLKIGDILISLTGNVGRVSTVFEENLLLNQRVGLIIPHHNVAKPFILAYLRDRILSHLESQSQGGAQKNISKGNIVNLPLTLPSLPEQEKIGEFLSSLDTEVEQAERLVSLLSDRKKAYAQRIFDRTLRFHDDNDNPYPEWEEKRLGEVSEINMGQSPKNEFYKSEFVEGSLPLVQGNADISKGEIKPSRWSTCGSKTSSIGDTLISVRAPVGEITSNKYGTVYIGRGFASIKSVGSAQDFLTQMLKFLKHNKRWDKVSQGTVFSAIDSKTINRLPIPLPSLPEQEKIGEFLSTLDDEIDEAKRELGLLKERKKAYAQKIFGV